MKKVRVAINGFGRIGRLAFRNFIKMEGVEVVAVNDLTGIPTLAHLLKYDSVHGRFPLEVKATQEGLLVGGNSIAVYAKRNPEELPWGDLAIDVVLESTGVFRDKEGMSKHLSAGARKVVLSAPASGDIKTVVLGVNDEVLSAEDTLMSNASCTTNCLAPMAKILDDKFGIERGFMTTVHAYTADQNLQDAPHSDLRRARAAALSIIPTSTGAAKAVGLVLPQLKGKLDGYAMRVPTPTGSATDLTLVVKKEASVAAINQALKEASENELKGILEYTEDPIVSADIMGNPHSCIFDAGITSVNGNVIKVLGWYDNEAGYSARVADLVGRVGKM